MLVAVTVYTPAAWGAMSVTCLPLELVVELKDPPGGVKLHVTPVALLVVAVRLSGWPTVTPACRGEIEMAILPALMVREKVAAAVSVFALESDTSKVNAT